MPNADEATLAKYRLNKAEDCLSAAKLLLQENLYADSANRSYYAIFHAINALFALRSIGFKKHAGVLANFNTDYIKTGIFEIEYAKIAKSAFSVRTYSDYSDFYIVSKQDTEEQYENAVKFVQRIREYVTEQIN